MAILLGIDEAGYGPLLGPLVLSSCAFKLSDENVGADHWQLFRQSVGVTRRGLGGRLLITDSKKAHNKKDGIKHLQRTTHACLEVMEKAVLTKNELLRQLCPEGVDRLKSYPWHRGRGEEKLLLNEADIKIASNVFGRDLADNNARLLDIRSKCLDVGYYNHLVDKVKNKSKVLFAAAGELIYQAWQKYSTDGLQVVVDRQGGRIHYRRELQRIFEGCELEILKEGKKFSSYQIRDGKKQMRIHFAVKADGKFLAVSLASMVSKYVRELLVENINHYFREHHDQLKPTAGYWQDGQRFLADLERYIPHVEYDRELLVRSR